MSSAVAIPFQGSDSPLVHVAVRCFQEAPKGGIGVRAICGWKGFVNDKQIRKENPTCPKCVEGFKAGAKP